MKKLIILLSLVVTFLIGQDYSLYFDGDQDWVEVANLSQEIVNSNATLMGWFKSTSNGQPNIYHEGIFGFRNYPEFDANYYATLNWTGWNDGPRIECSYWTTPANIHLTPDDETWYHIALVFNDGVFSTYLNGVLQASGSSSEMINNPNIELLIGNNIESNSDHFFQGYIDDVSLWSIALSEFEIQSYLSTELNGSEIGLKGYWDFNAGLGNILYDLSNNENHGTIYGAEWIYSDGNENVHLVPAEYPTIQSAIDASSNGDTILVSAGTYYENINFNGKNISVIGEDRENTIIDGSHNGSVVTISSGESELCLISSFTITNGLAPSQGGGFYIQGSQPVLHDLIINNNESEDEGGGLMFRSSHVSMSEIIIEGNTTFGSGGGIHTTEGTVLNMNNVLISNNYALGIAGAGPDFAKGGGMLIRDMNYGFNEGQLFTLNNVQIENNQSALGGGGIYAFDVLDILIENSIISNNISNEHGAGIGSDNINLTLKNTSITNNTAMHQGGGIWAINSFLEIDKTTFVNNNSVQGGAIYADMGTELINIKNSIFGDNGNEDADLWFLNDGSNMFTFCNLPYFWGGEGNISEDPHFTDPDNDDYTLQSTSPCIDAGDPNSELDPDGTRTDMGAYYFHQIIGCTDELACNYDENANTDDGSCDYSCHDNGDYSLSFDGQNYVELPFQNNVLSSGEFNVRVNFDSINLDAEHIGIYSLGNEPFDGDSKVLLGLHRWFNDNIIFGIYSDTWYWVDSGIPPSLNTWYNITCSWGPEGMKIYIDGVLKDSNNFYEGIPSYTSHYIGAGNQANGGFEGMIDNLIIESDEEELAYYKFNQDGYGQYSQTLIDYSGNQNHGTIYGAEWLENTILGDLNSDYVIDIIDIVAMINYIINLEYNEQGDMNGDGELNILDVLTLLYSILNT